MPAPLAPAIVAAIARAAVSNAARKRLMQAAAKKVTEKEIKALIKTEMKTGAPKLGRANRRPDVANPPKRVVSSQGQTGSVKPPKVDPAKELYNLYRKKPDTKTVTKSMQKDRVTPADVVAKRIAQKNERIKAGTRPSRVSKPPKRQGLTEELKARQRALAIASKTRSDKEVPIDARNPVVNPERPPKSELAAFSQLSKAEQKNYNRIEARIAEAIKAARKAEKAAAKKKSSSPKRTK
jgi:hypothetical protein